MLLNVFQNHAINGNDEANDFGPLEDLFRCIKERVQYNHMVYMGTCGGACCAGKWLWSMQPSGLGPIVRDFALFDFCLGVSLHYNTGMPVGECRLVVDADTFQITGGAALAVHIEKDIASASSFPCGKNNTWMVCTSNCLTPGSCYGACQTACLGSMVAPYCRHLVLFYSRSSLCKNVNITMRLLR